MWLFIVIGLVVVLVIVIGLGLLSGGSIYKKLFADDHLLMTGQRIAALKQAALANVMVSEAQGIVSRDDPRVLHTEADLVLVYTISNQTPGQYAHHASVSVAGSHTAHAVGEMFILLWANVLGVDPKRMVLGVSKATVHHAEFVLDEAEHGEFARRPVASPDPEWVRAFRAWFSVTGRELNWKQINS